MIKLRLQELLDESNIKPFEFAKILNLSDKAVIYNWLRGDSVPTFENIIAIADYFNCSIDYLLFRTEDNSVVKFKNPPKFSEQLKNIMKIKNISQYKMTKERVVYASYFNSWFVKKMTPSLETIIKLADYFNLSVDELVGRV